jgi:hypothetical protein
LADDVMSAHSYQINLTLAWLWIVLGFAGGFWMGLNFHREAWLGGYGSLQRRLCRLGHISFFGLAMVNLMFYFTVRILGLAGAPLVMASWGFVIGAISMPVCCFTMALFPKWRLLFLIPVLSLMAGGLSTLWGIIKL